MIIDTRATYVDFLIVTSKEQKEAGEINFNNRFIETNICKLFQKKPQYSTIHNIFYIFNFEICHVFYTN